MSYDSFGARDPVREHASQVPLYSYATEPYSEFEMNAFADLHWGKCILESNTYYYIFHIR